MTAADARRQLWRVFDGTWYRCAYPIVDELISRKLFARPEDVYAARGIAMGHSPNPFFSERWYLAKYEAARDEVAAGLFVSGFDHFCRHGHAELMPHWLFDPTYYRDQYRRAYGRAFDPAVEGEPYGQFLREGQFHGLSGHWLFVPTVYAALAPHDVGIRIMREGPFTAFLLHLHAGVREPVVSCLFDPAWYLERYETVAREVQEGRWDCALHHYLANEKPTGFDPSPRFSDRDYVARFPAVAAAVENGDFRNGFDHFLRHGRAEGRYFSPVGAAGPPATATFPLLTRQFDQVTLLPCQRDARSPSGHSFGVLDQDGKVIWDFANPRMAMRSANGTPSREPGSFIYGGMLTSHFGHVLTDGLANLWFLRQNPDLPVLWHWFDHPSPHDLWPSWLDQIWRILGVDQSRHQLITAPIAVDHLILPDSGIAGGSAIHERQAKALAVRQCAEPWQGNFVWLSRGGLPARFGRMAGEDEVEAILAARGWAIVRPEEQPVADQVDVFGAAAVVAGCIGSAFHAVLLCASPRARLIMVSRPGVEHTFYDAVAIARRLRQCYIEPDLKPYAAFGPEASFQLANPKGVADAVCEMAERTSGT